MLQILQNLKNGNIELVDIPRPDSTSGKILIHSKYSLISSGTERTLLEFGKSNYLGKIKSQPDKVKQVVDKIKTDGIFVTLDAVRSKLDQPIPLGYSNVGTVLETGKNITDFTPGDRVVSNGNHAEIVIVPQNLCAKIPDNVTDEEAVFTVLGAIAMQGIRLADPKIGENIVVTGLGVVGLLTVQILLSNGCRVLAFDYDEHKVQLARSFGAQAVNISNDIDIVKTAINFSNERGVDAVLITASTKSNEPIHQAAQMCRKRGRIVLIGVAGLELSRSDFYEKELTFQVSCSYGPGRYDPKYEQNGEDYPYGYVRWTAQRNFESVLDLMARNKINVKPLISKVIPFKKAIDAYDLLLNDKSHLGILLRYNKQINQDRIIENQIQTTSTVDKNVVVGMIGAGSFTYSVLLPSMKKTNARLKTIASANGTSSTVTGKKYGFEYFTSDNKLILEDDEINTVFIATRHNSHAQLVIDALNSGKHVFVEKPLALNQKELLDIKNTLYEHPTLHLMVGFNRRFSPFSVKIKELLDNRSEPLTAIYTVNAGHIPEDHWVHDPLIGGGRIVGEVCHFVDLLHYIIDKKIISIDVSPSKNKNVPLHLIDTVTVTLRFSDESTGTIHYFSNGSKKYEKENLTIFCQGRILELKNFKKLNGYGFKSLRTKKTWRQEKGQREEVQSFVNCIKNGGEPLIPWNSLEHVTQTTFEIVEKIKNSRDK